jgi:excisionase family DNA binding protein
MIEFDNMKYYSAQEVAKIFQVSLRTIRRYLKAGKLEYKKFGRNTLISEETIKDYLEGGNKTN